MTRYLLVGNGAALNIVKSAQNADVIIQMNSCKYFDVLPLGKTKWVFVTNTGNNFQGIVEKLRANHSVLSSGIWGAQIMLARNPLFYRLKYLWCFNGEPVWIAFHISKIKQYLLLNNKTMSFLSSWRLEKKMRKLGMQSHFMPSTGMIAYDWISRRIKKDDTLEVAGFTFEGWDRHPWQIEKKLIKSTNTP